MKISKYTFLFDINNTEFYIYSSLSNALIEIDEESFQILNNAKRNRLSISLHEIDKDLYNILIFKKFITNNDIDNFLLYKSILIAQRADKSNMHLTLAPTMDCCFSCHYCFENIKEKRLYMTDEVMDSIVKYIKSLESNPNFKLTWFGGEPLMALPQIEIFYDKLIAEYKPPINSNIITTGYHIDEEAIRVMKKVGINQVQITIDGLKDTHNKIKFISGCDDVFSKVLDNVEMLLSTSDIHVIFRINLTKQNACEYVELYNEILNRFKQYKKINISPAFVLDRGTSDVSDRSDFFTSNDGAQFIFDLNNKYKIHSSFLRYPSRFFEECAIRNVMSISFDPEGYAYKCWEIIGNKEYAIGKLNKEGEINEINDIILNRQLYGADPLEDSTCSKCKYLPICNGGCPIQRIENTFENKNNSLCYFYKGRIEEFLKIHISLKKQINKQVF